MLNKKLAFFTDELLSSFLPDDQWQHSCSTPPKKAFVGCGWPNCAACWCCAGAVLLWRSSGHCSFCSPVLGDRRTPQLQVRMRCHTSFSRTWRLQATFCILQNTAPHLKPVQWVTRYWTKSVAHCYAFGNAGSVLSNSTVSVTCCLWQSLCAQSWSIYSIFCVLAWMFHVCIRTWRSGPKLKSS